MLRNCCCSFSSLPSNTQNLSLKNRRVHRKPAMQPAGDHSKPKSHVTPTLTEAWLCALSHRRPGKYYHHPFQDTKSDVRRELSLSCLARPCFLLVMFRVCLRGLGFLRRFLFCKLGWRSAVASVGRRQHGEACWYTVSLSLLEEGTGILVLWIGKIFGEDFEFLGSEFYSIEFRERCKFGFKVIEVLKRGLRLRNLQNILLYFVEQ